MVAYSYKLSSTSWSSDLTFNSSQSHASEVSVEESFENSTATLSSQAIRIVESDSPVERLQTSGPSSLSTEELLSLLLSAGTSSSSLALTQRVIEAVQQGDGNLCKRLLRVDMTELIAVSGMGVARAARIIAAVELGRRLYLQAPSMGTVIDTPDLAAAAIAPHLMCKPYEAFVVVCLDIKHRFLSSKLLSMGTDTETLAHPRIIFGEALRRGSARIIVGHNHPSGDVDPSPDDIALTRQLLDAGTLLDVPVLDHLILGCGTYKSLRQSTQLWKEIPQAPREGTDTTVHEQSGVHAVWPIT
ncbi:DNA repair protein RadC [Leptolyngbya sp. PL-A3]|uniref:RadC family protein n=1 Tax=Leptolyngbya sp. PL-A3 TaxID=2933911 RepID=UPI0032986E95